MQPMLAGTHGKPWPALITLWRGITLPDTMIRLCQKEIFSTFAIINICWNALKYCLIKLLFTIYKAASLGHFTQLSVSCWRGGFVPSVLVEIGVIFLLVMEFFFVFEETEFSTLLVSELFHFAIQTAGNNGTQGFCHSICFSLPSRGEAHGWTENKNTFSHTKKITTHDLAVCRNDKEILLEREEKKKDRYISKNLHKPVKVKICSISRSSNLGLLHFSSQLPPSDHTKIKTKDFL